MTTELVSTMRGIACLVGGGAIIATIAIGYSWPLMITVVICGMILSFTSGWVEIKTAPSRRLLSPETRRMLFILIEGAFWSVFVGMLALRALGWTHTVGYYVLLALGATLISPSMRVGHLCNVSSFEELAGEIGVMALATIAFLFLVSL
jgi:fatty acid desaturase